MNKKNFLRKAQSTLEYAALIAIVVGAIFAMQAYIKRGLQGTMQSSADSIGEQYSTSTVSGTIITNVSSNSFENVSKGVTTSSTNQIQNQNKSINLGTLSEESWGQ